MGDGLFKNRQRNPPRFRSLPWSHDTRFNRYGLPTHHPLMPTNQEFTQLLSDAGPTVLLAAAVLALWKRDEKRDKERLDIGRQRDERISALEAKQDQHASQYRELAERMADVVSETKHVMEKVLHKLG